MISLKLSSVGWRKYKCREVTSIFTNKGTKHCWKRMFNVGLWKCVGHEFKYRIFSPYSGSIQIRSSGSPSNLWKFQYFYSFESS